MLTTPQLQAIKAAIIADQTMSALPNNSDGAFTIAGLLNATASPEWVVWRTSVPADEIMLNGFDWARVDNLSVGKARIWQWMFDNEARSINPSKANIRAGIDATWVGTASDLAVRAAVYVHCKMAATVAQKILSSGTGTTATPAIMADNIDSDYQISYQEVEQARQI